ncbi:hypothetical protein [Parasitella parasitica]|uniref:NAB co-repressor domain-containing protein n=1 Tax=Parasitella parasitica TaxID=35722 RepID=A0A0B7MXV6_9FUNG|nr:hypothetical protein [Parasitella parasitica]
MSIDTSQTLKSFLLTLQLEQYHQAFIEAGATDQDLDQIVQFTDQELSEFLKALNMLPFHSIKFKKAVRQLNPSQQPPSQPQERFPPAAIDTTPAPCTREFIISNATIYGKKTNRPLTSYEEAINRASTQLALENPLLISKKGDLFDLAKKKLLEEGYHYKRGSSRSKLREKSSTSAINTSVSQHENHQQDNSHQQQQAIMIKRQENAQRLSEQRLERIETLQQQVDHAIQCRQATENQLAQNSTCRDTLTQLAMESEIIRYEETKIKLTREISKLKAQERKHQWYKRRKLERTASNSSHYNDEGFSSQSSSFFEENFHSSITSSSTTSSLASSSSSSAITTVAASQHPFSIGFSVYKPLSPASSSYSTSCPSSQEYNDNEDGEDESSLLLQSRQSISSQSSSTTVSSLLCCPKESDVRATSSINRYSR